MARFWVADIGGTNCRLAQFVSAGELVLEKELWLPTASLASERDLLAAFAEHFSGYEDLKGLCLALAGPVTPEGGALTNAKLVCHRQSLQSALRALLPAKSCPEVLLINDFAAQAYAVLPLAERSRPLRRRQRAWEATCVRAVIGAGTGLGAAMLVQRGESLTVCASEAGHMPFPFRPDEYEYARYLSLEKGLAEPTCEDIISGSGLSHLQAFLTAEQLEPKEIGQRYLQAPSPTLRLFARFYGRFCRIWLYSTCCYDGLWIGGGIALANPLCVQSPEFFAEIEGQGVYDWVSDIPLWLFPAANSGLWGACEALRWQLRDRTPS
ncbi:MAG: ROK family protein [Desulfovibrio sp.]|nr:ROK family protein [Desulfovibrio sp.]